MDVHEAIRQLLEEKEAKGRVEGVGGMSRLVQILLGEGSVSDLQRASTDGEFRDSLFAQYGL